MFVATVQGICAARTTGTMNARGLPNLTRLNLYADLAEKILSNTHSAAVASNLLLDIRFSEIPHAFATAIIAAAKGGDVPDLEERFANLMDFVTFMAFGTTERDAIPSWFLQNQESFLAACLHRVLREYSVLHDMVSGRGDGTKTRMEAERALKMVFALCSGSKAYLSLDCLATSTKSHAVLTVANHSRYDFLKMSDPCPIYMTFMNMLAELVLTETWTRDVTNVQTAFGYFSGAQMWRRFSRNCIDQSTSRSGWVVMLEEEVSNAYAELQVQSDHTLRVLLKRKRGLSDASSDSEYAEDAECAPAVCPRTPPTPSTPSTPPTNQANPANQATKEEGGLRLYESPPSKRRCIKSSAVVGAMSGPFSKLVERLGLGVDVC